MSQNGLRGAKVDPLPGRGMQIQLAYAEDLPGPKLDHQPHALLCLCHKVGIMRVLWDPYERALVLVCAESGMPTVGVKVEKKNRLLLDPQRPGQEEAPQDPSGLPGGEIGPPSGS